MLHLSQFINKAVKLLEEQYSCITNKTANKIVNKYINAVSTEVDNKCNQYKLSGKNKYYISQEEVTKNSRVKIKCRKNIKWSTWFNNNCPLYALDVGHQGNKRYSEIKMYYKLEDYVTRTYNSIIIGELINQKEAVLKLYGKDGTKLIKFYKNLGLTTSLDVTPINMPALQNYIYTETNDDNVHDAMCVYISAYCHNEILYQLRSITTSARIYYRGINIQSSSKAVRHAALGECKEYDLNNAALVYRLQEVQTIDGSTDYPFTLEYINNKDIIRSRLSKLAGLPIKIIKQVFTAMGFGAEYSLKDKWYKIDNRWRRPAINSLITSEAIRTVLFTDKFMQGFCNEQKKQANLIYKHYKVIHPGLKKGKLLAYLYQAQETQIMNNAFSHVPNGVVLLRCHDAFYVRGLSDTHLEKVKQKLKQYNPALTISEEIHNGETQ